LKTEIIEAIQGED